MAPRCPRLPLKPMLAVRPAALAFRRRLGRGQTRGAVLARARARARACAALVASALAWGSVEPQSRHRCQALHPIGSASTRASLRLPVLWSSGASTGGTPRQSTHPHPTPPHRTRVSVRPLAPLPSSHPRPFRRSRQTEQAQPSTSQPTGPQPTGPQPTGPQPTGPQPTGPQPTGPQPTGPQPTGPQPTGPQPTAPPVGIPPPRLQHPSLWPAALADLN